MNYRHIFHAGNFSDVVKHFVLTLCLEKLVQKSTPFCVIDTHAGVGQYNLASTLAQKTKEFERGIERVLKAPHLPASFESYIKVVTAYNGINQPLTLYPGSPLIARNFIRPDDRLILSELHPVDAEILASHFKRDPSVTVLNQDAYISLKALLPPREKRGLVLIDPPFEKKDEFNALVKGMRNALDRFAHGMYMIWFPIKDPRNCNQFYSALQSLDLPKTLLLEFFLQKPIQKDILNGCGIILINPPFQLDKTLKRDLPALTRILTENKGYTRLEWLAHEKKAGG
jgi:23S rRNA (adenine2030-N6)-methyltransferase